MGAQAAAGGIKTASLSRFDRKAKAHAIIGFFS